VEHEKKTFFSSLKNSRSEDGSQGRAALQRVHRSEAETLDGHRSGGYARQRAGIPVSASILCFQHVNAAATQGYRARNRQPPIFPLAALFSTRLPA
jgi:hypothetical protein